MVDLSVPLLRLDPKILIAIVNTNKIMSNRCAKKPKHIITKNSFHKNVNSVYCISLKLPFEITYNNFFNNKDVIIVENT